MDLTPTQRYAETLIKPNLADFIEERRNRDLPLSWYRIALDIRDATKGRVDVTGPTVRNWGRQFDIP